MPAALRARRILMRGDRRSFEGERIGREDAAHAGSRELHRSLQARDGRAVIDGGRRGRALSCAEARHLLAAYRRDDWPTGELSALRRHLADCAACRRAEAEFRGVGEQIRRLPSRTPPPAFRAAVFAAIPAEQRRLAPTIAPLSRAPPHPRLPAVRPAP